MQPEDKIDIFAGIPSLNLSVPKASDAPAVIEGLFVQAAQAALGVVIENVDVLVLGILLVIAIGLVLKALKSPYGGMSPYEIADSKMTDLEISGDVDVTHRGGRY